MAFAFNDILLALGKNGAAPSGSLEAVIAKATRDVQHAGRLLFHFPGAAVTGATVCRYMRPNFLEGGGRRQRMSVHITGDGSGTPSGTPGVILAGNSNIMPGGTSDTYPDGIIYGNSRDDGDDDNVTGNTEEQIIGTDSVYLRGACLYEEKIPDRDVDISDTIDASKFAPGRDVLATQAGSFGTMDQIRDRVSHVWRMRRPVYNWAAVEPNYIEFSTSSQQWRYMFDQAIGEGGVAPAEDGPANCSFPCYASGIGRQTTVRVYAYAYAAMSGATDTGYIGVANKDSNGTMQAFQDLQNTQPIGGTGYAWYPSLGAFNPATAPYFEMPTGVAFDRICIGGLSDGATDKLRIKSLCFFVFPSMA